MTNTSGQGSTAAVPAEIDRWNWGAFLLHWIWGIGNNTLIALLMFVPFANLVMPFVLGAKGSAWAWRNKQWESVEQFRAVQRKWALWGVVAWAGIIALFVAMIFAILAALKSSEAYQLGVTALRENGEVAQVLGQPLTTGVPSGSIQVSGPSGTATLSFGVEGPNGKGTLYLDAVKDLGEWRLNRAELEVEGSGRRIDLVRPGL